MLKWAITFLILALIAGLFGFGLIANLSFGIAKVLFYIFAAFCYKPDLRKARQKNRRVQSI